MKKICLLFSILFILSTALSGLETNIQKFTDFDIIYPSCFDKDDPQAQPLVFILTLTNDDSNSQGYKLALGFDSDTYGTLLSLSDGTIENYSTFNTQTVCSDSICLQPNETINITNRDIIADGVTIMGDWDNILDNHPDFEDIVINGGFLPAGNYSFTLRVTDAETGEIYFEDNVNLNITNPSSIELIYPGDSFSNNPPEVYSNLPIFSWFSTANIFNFQLWEVEQGQGIDEIINQETYYEEDNITGNILEYPESAPSLNPGQVYAWRVTSEVNTTLGQNELESSVWNFVLTSSTIQNPEVTNINNFLENLDNSGLINTGQLNLQGFSPTGEILLNGEPISPEELMQLLNNILGGGKQIENIVIE